MGLVEKSGKKSLRFKGKLKLFFLFSSALFLPFEAYSEPEPAQRFYESKEIRYNISFNGIPSGHVNWKYLGLDLIDEKEVVALAIESNADILRLLNLASSEKIYLDAQTNLPVRVERDVKLFGSKEVIEESYDQNEGKVTIARKDQEKGEKEKEVYRQEAPIHNILELLYFFPEDIDLEARQGEWMSFNLPNQEVQIRFHSKREVVASGERKEAYFLEGKGARRFNLWLSQDQRIPLRLDFLGLAGRIVIRKD